MGRRQYFAWGKRKGEVPLELTKQRAGWGALLLTMVPMRFPLYKALPPSSLPADDDRGLDSVDESNSVWMAPLLWRSTPGSLTIYVFCP